MTSSARLCARVAGQSCARRRLPAPQRAALPLSTGCGAAGLGGRRRGGLRGCRQQATPRAAMAASALACACGAHARSCACGSRGLRRRPLVARCGLRRGAAADRSAASALEPKNGGMEARSTSGRVSFGSAGGVAAAAALRARARPPAEEALGLRGRLVPARQEPERVLVHRLLRGVAAGLAASDTGAASGRACALAGGSSSRSERSSPACASVGWQAAGQPWRRPAVASAPLARPASHPCRWSAGAAATLAPARRVDCSVRLLRIDARIFPGSPPAGSGLLIPNPTCRCIRSLERRGRPEARQAL